MPPARAKCAALLVKCGITPSAMHEKRMSQLGLYDGAGALHGHIQRTPAIQHRGTNCQAEGESHTAHARSDTTRGLHVAEAGVTSRN